MTTEKKQLLLKDLCARLPFHKIICKIGEHSDYILSGIDLSNESQPLLIELDKELFPAYLEHVKPYLRSMSSMTDNEREDWYRQSKVDYDCEFKPEPTLSLEHCHLSVDWLISHHFDYRGLIEKGLALEAPEDMYKQ